MKHVSLSELNRRIDYRPRYALALLGPVFSLLLGISLYYFLIRDPPLETFYGVDLVGILDGFYWSMITMTVSMLRLRPSKPLQCRACF